MSNASKLEKRLIRLFSQKPSKAELIRQHQELLRILDEAPEEELREAIVSSPVRDLPRVIQSMPLRLADIKMVDEAVALANRLGGIFEPAEFFADQALILARDARRDAAIARLRANLASYPDHLRATLKAAEAWRLLGQAEEEEAALKQALANATEPLDRTQALAWLENLLHRQGRRDELEEIRRERSAAERMAALQDTFSRLGDLTQLAEEAPEPAETVRHEQPKLGRNDPCHCGSGKKYKKCCFPN